MYKLNMFLREWEGYDKVYNFFKRNIFTVMYIKLFLYLFALIFISIPIGIVRESLRLIVYSVLFVLEYFFACINREQEERTIYFLSCILIGFAIFTIIMSAIFIIVSCI